MLLLKILFVRNKIRFLLFLPAQGMNLHWYLFLALVGDLIFQELSKEMLLLPSAHAFPSVCAWLGRWSNFLQGHWKQTSVASQSTLHLVKLLIESLDEYTSVNFNQKLSWICLQLPTDKKAAFQQRPQTRSCKQELWKARKSKLINSRDMAKIGWLRCICLKGKTKPSLCASKRHHEMGRGLCMSRTLCGLGMHFIEHSHP